MTHNTEKNNKRNQRGLSLIETSMVLALSAIVVSGVMYYYQAASNNNKTQSTVSEVMSIVSAVNGLYVGTSGYAGLTEDVIMNTSAIPENYKDGQNIMHPFGGTIELGNVLSNAKSFYIILKDIPKGPCVNIASMNFGTQLVGVGVGNTAAIIAQYIVPQAPTDGSQQLSSQALSPAGAANACKEDKNSIAFQLR
ncbi:prepilin-type N-terminal cleavage/methylation domain-containing protein [Escherichia coli]|nr:prepilin-type N-terminal cleavage/methylation domain-containing protein [Escherichia coli]EGJ5233553.1 prepilin-type N-terminal cleavage/methylation domain-containing protein [Escherichia coli]EGN3554663.1 prepilin-type N-terminal cleavage/methylation domain-containing protein [Escherichia coli]EHC2724341.1 prepilin-type N-terminal cleavage/methylation domain-containing protein [Escherichia coli]HCN9351538.1 prepilin-type N-terminal cleavage/methylation domain-containing protein [Escherichia